MHDSDSEILELMRRDMEAGFERLVKAYTERIYWHVRRLVVAFDDADDVVQETFIRIFKSFRLFRGECRLSSWIYRIATNEALRFIEDRERRGEMLELDTCSQDLAADAYVDWSDKAAVNFQKAVRSLPRKQQMAFNLRYYDELGYEEIGEIIGSSAASAKASFHEAKNKIQTYLVNNAI